MRTLTFIQVSEQISGLTTSDFSASFMPRDLMSYLLSRSTYVQTDPYAWLNVKNPTLNNGEKKLLGDGNLEIGCIVPEQITIHPNKI